MNFNNLENFLEEDKSILMIYGGNFNQDIITSIIKTLEKEFESNCINKGMMTKILTIFIELSQNLLHYAKTDLYSSDIVLSSGKIIFGYEKEKNNYYILSRNIVNLKTKEKLMEKLETIIKLSLKEIKKMYMKLLRNGDNCHCKGAGVGLYEIAKYAENFNYKFTKIEEDKYIFVFKANILNKNKD